MSSNKIGRTPVRSVLCFVLASSALVGTVSLAEASPILFNPNTDFSTAPTTINFGGGQASYTFSYLGYDGSTYTVDSVATGGTALVNSSGFPGPGQQPIPFGYGTFIGANGYDTFTAFPGGAGIAYSIADDFIGLKFTLTDGDHFGFAEVAGPTLVQYGYESAVDTPIQANLAAVPEPLTLSLFAAGLAGAGVMRRRKKASA